MSANGGKCLGKSGKDRCTGALPWAGFRARAELWREKSQAVSTSSRPRACRGVPNYFLARPSNLRESPPPPGSQMGASAPVRHGPSWTDCLPTWARRGLWCGLPACGFLAFLRPNQGRTRMIDDSKDRNRWRFAVGGSPAARCRREARPPANVRLSHPPPRRAGSHALPFSTEISDVYPT